MPRAGAEEKIAWQAVPLAVRRLALPEPEWLRSVA
jgi:hypothetical protein